MESKIIIEIMNKLIGSIEPHGESNIDAKNLDHIKQYREITEHMIDRLDEISYQNKDAYQGSIQKIRAVAYGFNKKQHDDFKDFESEPPK